MEIPAWKQKIEKDQEEENDIARSMLDTNVRLGVQANETESISSESDRNQETVNSVSGQTTNTILRETAIEHETEDDQAKFNTSKTMNEDDDRETKSELGTTFKVETHEDEIVIADDVEYVDTLRSDADGVLAENEQEFIS